MNTNANEIKAFIRSEIENEEKKLSEQNRVHQIFMNEWMRVADHEEAIKAERKDFVEFLKTLTGENTLCYHDANILIHKKIEEMGKELK
jgi:hypothetical protein